MIGNDSVAVDSMDDSTDDSMEEDSFPTFELGKYMTGLKEGVQIHVKYDCKEELDSMLTEDMELADTSDEEAKERELLSDATLLETKDELEGIG